MPAALEVVHVPAGEELVAALRRIGEAGAAWLAAVGVVEDPALVVAGGEGETRALTGQWTLVHLAGPTEGPFGVTLASAAAGEAPIVAGLLERAESRGVSVLAHASAEAAGAGRGWAARALGAAAEQASHEAEADEESDMLPEFNDRVIHPVFGLCDVMVVKGERLKIRDVEGPSRLREIHLGVMKVLRPVEQDGRRVFRLVKRS